jgi:hypothetical protein
MRVQYGTMVYTDDTSPLTAAAVCATICDGTVFKVSGMSSMARVLGNDGATIVQSDISAIHRSIYDAATGVAVEEGASLTVADVMFDVLQRDGRWTYDTIGYNFRDDVPATTFATGGEVYRIEYTFTPCAGGVWHIAFQLTAAGVLGS